jgi:hypothetical protein
MVEMRAMRAVSFTGYEGLKLVEVPRLRKADGRVLVRIAAAASTAGCGGRDGISGLQRRALDHWCEHSGRRWVKTLELGSSCLYFRG